jgi:Fur family transcriptional regulator, ferric uptake regulator
MSCSQTLKRKGYKLTPQRRVILDIIHETPSHLTADDIYNLVQQRISGVNKSTVYRTLELLEDLDCVVRSEMGERFIYHHAEEGHHHHLVCRQCGRTIEMSETRLEPMRRMLLDDLDFQVDIKHLVLHGLCADCRK